MPLARRAAPAVKLAQEICLRCSKRIGVDGESCNYKANRKCTRCAQIHKECTPVPPGAYPAVNSLFRKLARRDAAIGNEQLQRDAALKQAVQDYTKEVEATIRKESKQGGTSKPPGDDLRLLQLHAINQLGSTMEGILDVLRHMVSSLCDVILIY